MEWLLPPSRRRFLQVSTAASLSGPALAWSAARPRHQVSRIIFLNLVGGPSQLDTFDPKPAAPLDVRGPFRPISTSVPGLHLTELLPRTARLAHHVALIRTLHHDAAPIHETGQQLVQTGNLAVDGLEPANWSALLASRQPGGGAKAWLAPGPLRNTGVMISQGQSAGPLGAACQPVLMPLALLDDVAWTVARQRFGDTPFGRACFQALRLIEREPAFITINMFDTVFDQPTWDCHADGGSLRTTLGDLARHVAPAFDAAFSSLVEALLERGLWRETLLVATGEFGRTPRLNRRGGRDHWPHVWTGIIAGGAVPGGAVVGRSDEQGAYPKDDAVPAAALPAFMAAAAGLQAPTGLCDVPAVLRQLGQ